MLVFNSLVAIGRALKAWPLPLVISLVISMGRVYSTGGMMLYHSKKSHDRPWHSVKQVLGNAGAADRGHVLGQYEDAGLLSSAAGQGDGVCERLGAGGADSIERERERVSE